MEADDGNDSSLSVEDQKVLRLWEDEISYSDGDYTLPIPWREGRPNFPDNEYVAECRLNSLERKLERMGIRDKYSENIAAMIDKGYAEPVPLRGS